MEQIKMGALYLNDVAQINPQNPTYYGDIPKYDGAAAITIAEASRNYPDALITWNVVHNMEKWSRTGTLLIADRTILVDVSWDDLVAAGFIDGVEVVLKGQKFRCHLLPVGEDTDSRNAWDDALNRTTEDDKIWHWESIFFWGCNTTTHELYSVNRGSFVARCWNFYPSDYRDTCVGVRPALEPLDEDWQKVLKDSYEIPVLQIKIIIRKGVVESILFDGEYAPAVEVVDVNDAHGDYEKLQSYADELYNDGKYQEISHTMASFCDDEEE